MVPPPAYVLAGGKSSRFGSDKARALLDGTPLIVRVAETLRAACGEVTAVADVAAKYADLDLPTIADRRPGLGPLAGVEAALADRLDRLGPGWVLLASCDLVGLKREWVETIMARCPHASRRVQPAGTSLAARSSEGDVPSAVAFREAFWQPFPAAYHTDLLPLVTELLDAGRASFQRLLSDPRSHAVPLPRPSDWPAVAQINTREDFEAFGRGDG
ncbi:MAG TPA: molybdenum cofactor guanylyltransferase [Planctomycetaceae bacterium]